MNHISLFLPMLAVLFFSCSKDDKGTEPQVENETLVDVDGNVYHTIKMGNQIWMLENLKTTKYNDGTPITFYTLEDFGINWGSINDEIGHYQWASTEDFNNAVEEDLPFDYYGAMYNHFAIESGKLAPEGWRIPSVADFEELESFLAGEGHAGNEATVLKTETGWLPSVGGGTNLYGFNALPNGYVSAQGSATFGQGICTWVTTDVNSVNPGSKTRMMLSLYDQGTFQYKENAIQIGAAIRCIKN